MESDAAVNMIDRISERAIWIEQNILPHERYVRAWLSRHRAPDLEIDDVVQEMYAKIGSLDTFDHIRNPKHYALQTVHSILLNHIRRSHIVSISAVGDFSDWNLISPDANPEQQVSLREEIAEISSAIASLPERTRDVLMLRRVEGLSQRETAIRLSIAEKTVEKHLSSAALMLANRFGRGGKRVSQASSIEEHLGCSDENDDN